MYEPNILVFASGTKTGGGSGFEKVVRATRSVPRVLDAKICAVVTNHRDGGVWQRAGKLHIHREYWPGPYLRKDYQDYVIYFKADFVMLSGWLKCVAGLDPARTINIHPGPLPRFGGPGFHGHHVHEAVLAAYHRGEITHSAVNMHFVDDEYDRGPIFFQYPVEILPDDTPDSLAARVNRAEHEWQPLVLNYVVHDQVRLVDGKVVYENDTLKNLLMPAGD
jgi:phosphoribosylglycinamide formyltransferase 1